ncbi:hypothetical protein B2K_16435 [Paenibacillus mucilaginosus K02]|uniref:Uncharacterized protein n=1 Tax=Paenibacillus mucilaginosus K02 TaxID=997761 RepID=I0BIU2_9BACL|nr:hypothetical protein B2K_16435 [Paenibacillus mucilaginosus K02]
MEMIDRIAALKRHEVECYRICYYLLQCEKLASEAATIALRNLSCYDTFFTSELDKAKEILRKASLQSALSVKKKYLNFKFSPN